VHLLALFDYLHVGPRCILVAVLIGMGCAAYGANQDGAEDLGVDYAFMSLMTVSPDFAAANYTIRNDGGSDVDISIRRLPYHIELVENDSRRMQLELSLAYQRTSQLVPTYASPDEYIDAEWDTYGLGLGLLYESPVTERLIFTPGLRIALADMKNHAVYHGTLTNLVKDQFEGSYFNWDTKTAIYNIGLGLEYNWKLLDRSSHITADVWRVVVDSFGESHALPGFTAGANMATVKADMVFPTTLFVHNERLDLVVLLGANNYFGENKRTLGYTVSYQMGAAVELPLKFKQRHYGHLRLGGQALWASNMDGWLLTIGYNAE